MIASESYATSKLRRIIKEKRPSSQLPIGPIHLSLRHLHDYTRLRAFLLEDAPDLEVFILIFDLPAALVEWHIGLDLSRGQFVASAQHLEGQIACRLVAGVEVLMKPTLWRNDNRTWLPVDPHLLFSLGPHERVPLP